jgi:hypothetical protein
MVFMVFDGVRGVVGHLGPLEERVPLHPIIRGKNPIALLPIKIIIVSTDKLLYSRPESEYLA